MMYGIVWDKSIPLLERQVSQKKNVHLYRRSLQVSKYFTITYRTAVSTYLHSKSRHSLFQR